MARTDQFLAEERIEPSGVVDTRTVDFGVRVTTLSTVGVVSISSPFLSFAAAPSATVVTV